MRIEFIRLGTVAINGRHHDYDVVIEGGRVRKRVKKPSQRYRDDYGHTPLSAAEQIPWGGEQLIVGTGVEGRLAVMADVYREADRRGVEVVVVSTREACRLLRTMADADIHAIIHVTC